MRTYNASEARNKFAEIIDIARRDPVAISKKGRVVSVILAKEDYERYQYMEEQYWVNYRTTPSEDVTDKVNARIEKLEQRLLHT